MCCEKNEGNKEKTNDNKEESLDNYKGVYYNDQTTKYFDKITGAHFEYHDMYTRLEKLAQERNAFQPVNSVAHENESIQSPSVENGKNHKVLNANQIGTLDKKTNSSKANTSFVVNNKGISITHKREHSTEIKKQHRVKFPLFENPSESLAMPKPGSGLNNSIQRTAPRTMKHASIHQEQPIDIMKEAHVHRMHITREVNKNETLPQEEMSFIRKDTNNKTYIKQLKRPISREYKAAANKILNSEQQKPRIIKGILKRTDTLFDQSVYDNADIQPEQAYKHRQLIVNNKYLLLFNL